MRRLDGCLLHLSTLEPSPEIGPWRLQEEEEKEEGERTVLGVQFILVQAVFVIHDIHRRL